MFRSLMIVLISLMTVGPAAAQERSFQSLQTSEFLGMPDSLQRLYVAGILDGLIVVAYGDSGWTPATWVNCVRGKSLGGTTKDVVAWLGAHSEFRENPVAESVIAVMEARSCRR